MLKFLSFTYKELLKKFLGGRTQNHGINVQFFQGAFEQNECFGWVFIKILLKCILPKEAKAEKGDDEEMKENGDHEEDGKGSRSNH